MTFGAHICISFSIVLFMLVYALFLYLPYKISKNSLNFFKIAVDFMLILFLLIMMSFRLLVKS
jgi:hypothetical protein